MKLHNFIFLFLFLFSVLVPSSPARAQDNAWGDVLNPDGSINYGSLTDHGVVKKPADFMPSIPNPFGDDITIPAQYHVYSTQSGNQVLMPTATTLFFMATDPGSALYTHQSLGTSGGSMAATNNGQTLVGVAALGNMVGAMLGTGVNLTGGQYNSNFFNSVLNGQQNIWQVGAAGTFNFLQSLYNAGGTGDFSLYTYMILVPPGACATSPAGCTMLPPPAPTPPVPTATPPPVVTCPEPQVIPGKISFDGSKTAPNYPLVIGQDPDERGVDIQFSASVAPTRYITYAHVPIYECTGPGGSCSSRKLSGYECVARTQTFDECIASANGRLSLSASSREWILRELSNRYPQAYLHHPDFSFSSGGGCAWSALEENIPIEDPGYWTLSVNGSTSGTPVSAPRSFGGQVETFEVWLKEIAIIK